MVIFEKKENKMANILSLDQKRKNAARIAKVALNLFETKSYNQISMNDIAQRAGVSKGTLFNYYKNKEDLFMSLLLKGYQNYFEKLTQNLKLTPLNSKREVKDFLLEEVDNLLNNYHSLVRLNALRGPIFEGKANQESTKENRQLLYKKSLQVSELIAKQVKGLNVEQLNHIFVIESAIISGLLNLSGLEEFRGQVIEQDLPAFRIDIRVEAKRVLSGYLEGEL